MMKKNGNGTFGEFPIPGAVISGTQISVDGLSGMIVFAVTHIS